MKVYKFGGASVKNAEGVRNLRKIIDDEQNLFIIVSAMGKTTNALERVFGAVQKGDRAAAMAEITALREYHAAIIDDLWHGPRRLDAVEELFAELERVAANTVYRAEDAELWYDTIVAFGELISTTIISAYLNYAGVANRWIDMRRCFLTEQRHKDAGVDIEASAPRLKAALEGGRRDDFRRPGLHRRRPRRDDHDARARGLGLLGGRGGQYPRGRVDVGVEGCGRCAERRSEDLPRCRADRRAELP